MLSNRVCSPFMRVAPFSRALWVALSFGSYHAFAQPVTVPWVSMRGNAYGNFQHAIRVQVGWIAVGRDGRIAAVRNGIVSNFASPLRDGGWDSVWAAETGELFVTMGGGSVSLVAMRARNGTWQLWKDSNSNESVVGLSATAVWKGPNFWDGTAWKSVAGLGDARYNLKVRRVGTKAFLIGDGRTWQLTGDRATRAPAFDGFSELGGSGTLLEWGIRNSEIFRFVGNKWVHFAQAPDRARIVTKGRETLFVTEATVMRVKGNQLVQLGAPRGQYDRTEYVGVAIEPSGVLALTSSGQELRLIEGQTQAMFADVGKDGAALHGAPTSSSECVGLTTTERIGATGPEDELDESCVAWRQIFTRGDQKFAIGSNRYRVVAIEQFDGKIWT